MLHSTGKLHVRVIILSDILLQNIRVPSVRLLKERGLKQMSATLSILNGSLERTIPSESKCILILNGIYHYIITVRDVFTLLAPWATVP